MPDRPAVPVLPRLTAALLAGVLAACSSAPTNPAAGRLTLVNATADTLVYGASELEASHLADLKAEFPADELRNRVVLPGAAVAVPVDSISAYRPGATVRFFFWRVRAGRARYRGSLDAAGAALARRGYRVEVTSAALGPAQP